MKRPAPHPGREMERELRFPFVGDLVTARAFLVAGDESCLLSRRPAVLEGKGMGKSRLILLDSSPAPTEMEFHRLGLFLILVFPGILGLRLIVFVLLLILFVPIGLSDRLLLLVLFFLLILFY